MPRKAADKVKVLHIITRLAVGGAQENTLYTVMGLDKNRYWVMLASGLAYGPEGNMEEIVNKNRIDFVKIPELVREIHLYKDLIAFFKLYNLIRRYRFDIVHTHTSKAGILGRCAAKIAGTKVIIHTPHGHLFYGYYGKFMTRCFIWLERTIARITSCIITLTEIGKKEHVSFGIAEPEKFRVVQSGIDIDTFKKTDPAKIDKLRKELGLSADNKVVGTVARLVPIKGHSYFIEAAEKIIRQIPQSRFMVVGDGVLRAKLEAVIKEKNLTDYFYFLGLRSDVPDILSLFDLFVLSSLNEGMGRAAVEAMAKGKPVVATRVGGIPEVVSDNDTGLLVEPGDIDGLAKSVVSLLKDEQRSMTMGGAGRERAKTIFSKEEMVDKIDNIYQEFLHK